MVDNQQDETGNRSQSNEQANNRANSQDETSNAERADQPSASQHNSENMKDKKRFVERVINMLEDTENLSLKVEGEDTTEPVPIQDPPWTLQQFFNGEIDLETELLTRFNAMPVMSSIRFRGLGNRSTRGVATLATQDGAAQVIFDADKATGIVQVSFTFASMLTLRFVLRNLVDRKRWIDLMRRSEGGLAFLWGPTRWEDDYVICAARRYYTNFYAFSPSGYEAAARFTPAVTKQLVDWLEGYWTDEDNQPDDTTPMLTW